MIFNENPTPGIPYGVITREIYRWFAGVYWAWNNPETGDRDGTLEIRSLDGGDPYFYALEYETPSLWNQYGVETFYLINSGGIWNYTTVRSQYTNNYVADPAFVSQIIANPELLDGYTQNLQFKFYYTTVYETLTKSTLSQTLLKPQIKDYFVGYSLDLQPHKVDIDIDLIPVKDGLVKLHFYYLEDEIQYDSDGVIHPVCSLQTLSLQLKQSKPCNLKLSCIPCSVSLEGDPILCADVKTQLVIYPKCFPNYLPTLKAYWLSLYETKKSQYLASYDPIVTIELDTTPYVWAATQRWGQQVISDRNTAQGIGESISNSFVHNKYFNPQLDDTFGSYIMPDSALIKMIGNSLNVGDYQLEDPIDRPSDPPQHKLDWYLKNNLKIDEIHTALDANKYSVNELSTTNPKQPRVTTIGHYIERISYLMGYRPEPDGTFNKTAEDARIRKVIPSGKSVDPKKVGVNNFGEDGMVLKRLNNRFNGDKIVADECVIVQDLIQLISEYHDQENLAFGIQESSAIEINNQNGTAKFNNQLELLIELVNLVKDSNEMIRSILVSGLVTQGQTTELIAGLGLPSVTKTLPITIDGKNKQIPYKGIAAHRSISQEVATVAYNVGIVTGQLI